MSPLFATTILVVLFAGASLLADLLRPRLRPLPVVALGVAVGLVMWELSRFDHGLADAYWLLAFVVAPIVLIFGGAAFGTRRFYGWPDFGPHPSRAAFVALCMLLGVLIGKQTHIADVVASESRAVDLRTTLLEWKRAHGGVFPTRLDEALPRPPRTALGALDSPPYAYGADATGRAILAIPLGADGYWSLTLESGVWSHRRKPPQPFAGTAPTGGS